jgi:ditrans,polycis-polyprenyl diphosphate synthase
MSMAKVKLEQLAEHGALLDRYGASIRVLGQRDLMKKDVLAAVDRAVARTAHNKKYVPHDWKSSLLTRSRAVLNVCFPYTSRDEITTAVMKTIETYSTPIHNLPTPSKRTFSESHITQHIRKQMLGEEAEAGAEQPESRSPSPTSKEASNATEDELSSSTSTAINSSENDYSNGEAAFLDPESISAQTLTDNMMTADAPPLDLLIRTSGVERLSDFMLWQCHEDTSIVFLKCLWPEFDLWQFLPVLVEWQWQQKKIQEGQQRVRGRPKSD